MIDELVVEADTLAWGATLALRADPGAALGVLGRVRALSGCVRMLGGRGPAWAAERQRRQDRLMAAAEALMAWEPVSGPVDLCSVEDAALETTAWSLLGHDAAEARVTAQAVTITIATLVCAIEELMRVRPDAAVLLRATRLMPPGVVLAASGPGEPVGDGPGEELMACVREGRREDFVELAKLTMAPDVDHAGVYERARGMHERAAAARRAP